MDPASDRATFPLIRQVILEAILRRRLEPDLRPLPRRPADEYMTVLLTLLEEARPDVPCNLALERAIDGTDRPSWFSPINELAELAHALEIGAITIH